MNRFSEVQIISEFTKNEITYGVYSAKFKGEQEIFIRNGDSMGVISFLVNEPANKCVHEIRDDVKQELLESIQ